METVPPYCLAVLSSLVYYIMLMILKTVTSARLLTMAELSIKIHVSGRDNLLTRDRIVIWVHFTASAALSHI